MRGWVKLRHRKKTHHVIRGMARFAISQKSPDRCDDLGYRLLA
jgi:hypothetical protein